MLEGFMDPSMFQVVFPLKNILPCIIYAHALKSKGHFNDIIALKAIEYLELLLMLYQKYY